MMYTRAGQTDDAEDLPVLNGQVDVPQGGDAAGGGLIGLAQML